MSAVPAAIAARSATDSELLGRIRAGDAVAMEVLMRRHNRTLYRTARAILRDDAEAEDAVQEAYVQAFKALATFREDARFSTWLVRIVANQALMRRRRLVRQAEVLPFDTVIDDYHVPEDDPMQALQPERQAMRGDVRKMLEKRIDALPDAFRAVFMLRAVEEMSVEETAAALDIPVATVRSRFFRARALLRAAIEADMDHAIGDVFGFDGERCDRIVAGVLARLGVSA